MAGASGLVGAQLVDLLLRDDEVRELVLLVRKPLAFDGRKLTQVIVDYGRLDAIAKEVSGDEIYVALGTTMKTAGSREAFRKVDLDCVVDLATLAARNAVSRGLFVSASGADATSSVFYSRVKGEMEAAVSALPFRGVGLFRPSFLVGDRKESRPGERAGIAIASGLSFALVGPLRKLKPIDARAVARAMVNVARHGLSGTKIFESDEIQRLAG